MTSTNIKISSVEELVKYLNRDTEEAHDFFINLGGVRSSKSIQLRGHSKKGRASFYVLNEIDDTRQTLTADSLYTRSNIGKAIDTGNFYAYGN